MSTDTDIVIAGGGIAGQMAALILAASGHTVVCADAGPPGAGSDDLRSTALLMPAIRLLDRIGLFARLRPNAAPLRLMRIVEASGDRPPRSADFSAAEAHEDQFGFNFPNAALRKALPEAIEAHPRTRLLHGVRVTGQVPRLRDTVVRLSDGTALSARLLVAADGRDSSLRAAAGISAPRTSYGQKALVFAVRHGQPHAGISTEVHRSGGPFTLVPLAGADQTRSAVVWMDEGPRIAALGALPPEAFSARASERSAGVMGALTLDSGIAVWPIISQHAARLDAPRMALIGEAAHVVPPIGAQGLNMSLTDIGVLADLVRDAADPGAPDLLTRYHRARWPDMAARVAGIDALNRASIAGNPVLTDLRGRGLLALAGIAPLRRAAIRAGLGR